MWAQAFSLVSPRIQQELGVADKDYGNIFSCMRSFRYFFCPAFSLTSIPQYFQPVSPSAHSPGASSSTSSAVGGRSTSPSVSSLPSVRIYSPCHRILLTLAAAGMVIGALSSWPAICALVFFVGFGLGGNIPIDATIVLEFLPNDQRYLLAALSVLQPIGELPLVPSPYKH